MDTLINLGLFLLAGAALVVSYLSYKTASRADERAKAADERNLAAELRDQVRFDFHDSEPFEYHRDGVKITLLHSGTTEVSWVRLDVKPLSGWAVHRDTAIGRYSPGETISFTIARNDHGLLPDSLRLTWDEPAGGSQNVALPPSLVRRPAKSTGEHTAGLDA